MIARLRIAFVAVLLVAMTLLLAPLQILATRANWRLARRLPLFWHRVAARAMGLRVEVRGAMETGRPLLLVANHQSWADIVTLGQAAELSFIAKSDVRTWPAFGTLAKLHRTVFVARGERRRTGEQADAIAERLAEGDAMVLFAEGTTSDGNEVWPFKTALFGAAQAALKHSGKPVVMVQPVALAYVGAHGIPFGRVGRPLVAWPGEVTLLPHLGRFLAEGSVDAVLSFGPAIAFTATSDRKAVAKACETACRRMLAEALARPYPMPAAPARQSALASGEQEADIATLPKRSQQKGA